MDVCIKNINEEEWRVFKSESIRHGAKIGDFFAKVIQEHHTKCKGSNWEKILYGEKKLKGFLTQSEYMSHKSQFRKEFTMREF